MKSGWFLTIVFNTFSQLALHVLACFRMGLTYDQMTSSEFNFAAGGDDVLNNFPNDFNLEEYFSILRNMGIDVKDFRQLNGMENAEFFSSTFHLVDGVVQTKPVRFTKHIYMLAMVAEKDIAQSLLSQMTNYCFSPAHFFLFKKMWDKLVQERPDLVGEFKFLTRLHICNRVLGLEMLD